MALELGNQEQVKQIDAGKEQGKENKDLQKALKDITDLIKDSTQSQEQAREALNDPNLGKKLSNVENVVKNFNKLPVSLQGKFTSTYMDTITTPLEKNYSFLKKETNADKIDNEESADGIAESYTVADFESLKSAMQLAKQVDGEKFNEVSKEIVNNMGKEIENSHILDSIQKVSES